jgi:arabinose-5-phosphate isomerase
MRISSAISTIEIEKAGLEAMIIALQADLAAPFEAVIEAILNAKGRVIVTGMGKSGHIGRKIVATLASTGTPAYFVHPAEASHGDLGMITEGDVIIALSWSGESAELRAILDYSRRFNVKLVAITSNAKSALAKAADIVLALPKAKEACPNGQAPTTSTLMQLALGDAIAVTLLQERGFSKDDFGKFHPGGKLGANLKYVRDLMHSGDAMPLITAGKLMSEALIIMTRKGFGCLGVLQNDALIGIITDGDLRRAMSPTLLETPVEKVMTASPLTAAPDQLVSETLERISSRRITALFVVKDRLPVGIVHFHDLLKAGVA